MAQLIIGDYPFSLASTEYDRMTRTLGWRWRQRDRLNRKPAQQYHGPEAQQIVLRGVIDVRSRTDLEQPQRMQATANLGTPLELLASNDTLKANYHGQWVITRLRFDESDLLGDGTPETIQFEMTLKEYGEDT